jgi:hypothetical protein
VSPGRCSVLARRAVGVGVGVLTRPWLLEPLFDVALAGGVLNRGVRSSPRSVENACCAGAERLAPAEVPPLLDAPELPALPELPLSPREALRASVGGAGAGVAGRATIAARSV